MSNFTEILWNLLARLKPIGKFFSETLSWWFTLAGLVLIVIGSVHPWGLGDNTAKLLSSIGSSVLVGGVFGVLLKSAQYLDLFEKVLRKIFFGISDEKRDLVSVFHQTLCETLYGKGKTIDGSNIIADLSDALKGVVHENHVLQQRKDLKELWETISVAMYKTRYGQIGEAIAIKLSEQYLPQQDSFYYEKFRESITSLRFVKPDNRYVATEEVIDLRVKPIDPSQPIDWQYVARLFKGSTDEDTKFFLDKLTVIGVDRIRDYPVSQQDIVDEFGRTALQALLTIRLEGAMEYDLHLEVRRIYDYDRNRQRDIKTSRFIVRPEFHVSYDNNELALTFLPVGTNENAYTQKGKSFRNVIWNEYNHLIFPNQGYTLLLDRKEAPPMSKDTIRV
jgi:hypothetical protein